jgi:RimJ/RimL family protein N-acetyltransferase
MKTGMNLRLWTTEVTAQHDRLLDSLREMGFNRVEIPVFAIDDPAPYERLGKRLQGLGRGATAVTVMTPETNPISASAARASPSPDGAPASADPESPNAEVTKSMHVVGLKGERVRLVPSEPDLHLENAVRWLNDPEVTAALDHFLGVTRREVEAYFERLASRRDTDLHWAILAEDGAHIGFTALHQIRWPARCALGGLLIGEKEAWGRGYATDAVRTRSRFAFEQLGLHRIEGHTTNPAMRRVYEKCGYRPEGIARKKVWRNGRWHDAHLFAILDEDYFAANLEPRNA